MGRRALPKIPTDCDISQHFLELDHLTPPVVPLEVFDNERPLEIEVGSGKGLFLADASLAQPAHSFLGIEIARKYARFIASRLVRKNVNNAKIISGDANVFFADFLADNQVTAVHIYFPDPWWKKRHHKRRIMNQDFLTRVTRVLKPGGSLHFWTDVEEYFRMSVALIETQIPLEGPLPVPESSPHHDLDYRTHFERKKRQTGYDIFRSEFLKPN